MNPFITFGVSAARDVGNVILRYINKLDRVDVEKKSAHNFTSEVDKIAMEQLIEVIHERFPQHSILCEENGVVKPLQTTQEKDRYEWIIDPINGTYNFLHNYPCFAISIAVKKNNTIEHSIIYDPLRDEIFTASKGQGAQINNRRIRVSGQNKFALSTVAMGELSKSIRLQKTQLACANKVMIQSAANRVSGSAALDLAYVACGRLEAFWQPQLPAWEYAAGSLLIQEGGGFVTNFNGNNNFSGQESIVAGNAAVFSDLLAIIKTNFKPEKTS